jgi:NAD(P)-dependent dehydrogenase (short-subunit alcohol dehydrogenase family)
LRVQAEENKQDAYTAQGDASMKQVWLITGNIGSIEDTELSDFRAQIETNLFGVINVTKAAIPVLREQGSGHIIQLSSVGGRVGAMGRAPYSAAKWGIEGFSEVLAKEMGPLGVKVTIIEPGGFRTDFAGSSTTIAEGRPEYDSTVGAAARFQRQYDGTQPGDPAKGAAVVVQVASLEEPPFRLLLGSDAVRIVEQADLARLEADRKWRHLMRTPDRAAQNLAVDFEKILAAIGTVGCIIRSSRTPKWKTMITATRRFLQTSPCESRPSNRCLSKGGWLIGRRSMC